MTRLTVDRRTVCKAVAGAAAALAVSPGTLPVGAADDGKGFRLRYIVASSLYGRLKLEDILPEVPKTGAEHIDIWPERHADQREQMERMGHEKFAALLKRHKVKLGMLTHYDLGPLKLQKEMIVARQFGARILIAGGMPKKPRDAPKFLERMQPHIAAAEASRVVIGIENHGESPEAIVAFARAAKSKHIGVALAPYHLKQDPALIARLVGELGEKLVHFYAWEYGMGCHKKLPKAQELMQMPGRGKLDFTPILAVLKKIKYQGWTSVFMHPVPRGIPILPTAGQVTAEILRAQKYLQDCLAKA
jgi:sugar phosphate isomerase/epimerase